MPPASSVVIPANDRRRAPDGPPADQYAAPQVTDQCIGVDGAARILTTTGNRSPSRSLSQISARLRTVSTNHVRQRQSSDNAHGLWLHQDDNALRSNFNSREQFTQCFTAPSLSTENTTGPSKDSRNLRRHPAALFVVPERPGLAVSGNQIGIRGFCR